MSKISRIRPKIIDLNREECDKDIGHYITNRLSIAGNKQIVNDEIMTKLMERCNGIFLYAELVCDTITDKKSINMDSIIKMPNGIGGLYCAYFDRLFPRFEDYKRIRNFLRVLCAFDIGNLSEDVLMRATKTDREELNRFYHDLRSFAKCISVNDKNFVSLFHKSLYDWLTNHSLSGIYYIDIEAGRKQILKMCAEIIERADKYEKHEYLLSTYQYVLQHGDGSGVKLTPEFLYALQCTAFDNSDLVAFRETADRLERNMIITGETRLYLLSQFDLASWYYDVALEAEKACALIDQLYANYSEQIANEPEIHAAAEINRIYIFNSYKKNYSQAWQWADDLIQYLISQKTTGFPDRGIRLSKAYYHRCIIEFRMEKYELCNETAEKANEAAEYAYKDPRKMKSLVYVVQGEAFRETKQYERAVEVLEKALEYRLDLYNHFSLFVANSYKSLIETLYQMAIETKSPFDGCIFDYLEEYKKAVIISVGDNNSRLINYYFYMALIAKAEKNNLAAVKYAKKCLQFENTSYFKSQIETAKEIIQMYS